MALETDRRIVIPEAGLRASDAERRDCSEALSAHFVEGRLDQAEFDERIGAAMAAKTRGELAALLADLPRSPRPPETPGPRRWSRLPLLVVASIVFAVAAFTSIAHQAPVLHKGLFTHAGPGIGRIVVQSSHSVLPLLVLVVVALLVVCAAARCCSPRGLDR
jgi:hypothetical protein